MPTQAQITNINPAMMTMSKKLMFANMPKAILLQFQPPKITKQEANKLKTNPRAIINSEDNKKYCSLSGWLKNNTFDDIHRWIEEHEKPVLYYANKVLGVVFYVSVLSLVGLAILESYGRRKDGIGIQIQEGTSWHRKFKKKKK